MYSICPKCGERFSSERAALGYLTCLDCGELAARAVVRCVVPLHKSNYILVTDPREIPGMCSKTNYTHGKDKA